MAAVPGRASYRWLTITLVAAAGVYAWYALSQYFRLNDLNQRQLSNAGAELKTALENAAVTVEQFNRKWNEAADAGKEQPRVCDFVASQPYLALRGCEPGSSPAVQWQKFTQVAVVSDSILAIKVSGQDKTSSQTLRYLTDRLLQELAFPDSFAVIFIAKDDGTVLFQEAPTRRRWLRHLRWGEQRFRDTHADRPPTLQVHNLQQVVGGDPAWHKLRAVSSRTTAELGGTDHQLYLQPLVLEGEQPLKLIIGGAVPRAAVVRDALVLGTPFLGVLVFLLLLGLLGFPFVKLAWLDVHERFTLRDIQLLYVSTGALLVLFTCGSLAADGYVRWHQEADRGLGPLAEDLENRFLQEVKAIRDQLTEYDATVAQWNVKCDKPVHTNWFQARRKDGLDWPPAVHLKTVAWIESGGWQIWKTTGDAVPGKLWVGNRVYFRAVRDENLFQIDGAGPPFFIGPDRSINDGKFYTFVAIPSRINPKSLVDPKLCADATAAGTVGVVSATARLLSLDRQPLPAGYGFALVNREGRVLYHSDGRLSLRENLYEELTEGDRARAMIYAGSQGGFDTRYRERPHRFYFYPAALSRAGSDIQRSDAESGRRDAGFYLVVFRDTSLEQALVGHVFVAALVGPLALLLLFSCGLLAVLSIASKKYKVRRWSVWLWPHSGLNHIYKRQVVAFLVLLLVSIGVYLRWRTIAPFLMSALLAPTLGLYIYKRGMSQAGERGSLSFPWWQRLSVFLVLVSTLVVPSAALFRLTLSHEFAKLILTERDWIEAQRDDGLRAARVEALEERYADDRAAQLRDARRPYLGCVPSPFDAKPPEFIRHTSGVRTASGTLPPVLQSARASLPNCRTDTRVGLPTDTVMQPIGLSATLLEAVHWIDGLLPVENELLARQHFRADEELSYSPQGTIVSAFKASEIALVGFAVTLVLLYWWIRWNSNQLFLADLDAAPVAASGTPQQVWARLQDHEKMVMVQIAREDIANPHQRWIVEKLLADGLLQLNPDVQPRSAELDAFLRSSDRNEESAKWQADADSRRNWQYGRLVLVSSLAAVGFFLIATQPGLQSGVVAIATGVAGILTAGSKVREAFTSLLARKTGS